MRFACEHCGKRYVVKHEVVPGRLYQAPCKACGRTMIVGDALSPSPAPPARPFTLVPEAPADDEPIDPGLPLDPWPLDP